MSPKTCLILAFCVSLTPGCAAVSSIMTVATRATTDIPNHLSERAVYKADLLEERRLDREAVHQARLEELADEREALQISREALLLKRQIQREALIERAKVEKEALEAEAELEVEAARPDYREKLQSELSLNFGQRVRVGQLQVDYKQLQERMKAWEEDHKLRKEDYENRRKAWEEQLKNQRRDRLDQVVNGKEALGSAGAADCARPPKEKLEDKLALEEPPQMTIMPTEIPLMLPVSLDVELDRPSIKQPKVRKFPLQDKCDTVPKENLEDDCDAVSPCPCPKCTPRGRCDDCLLGVPPADASALNIKGDSPIRAIAFEPFFSE